ncbi:MAG TPA: ABC transporter substrate-binding protein, partial [Blastocatellia bacterium]|nr:ABC transporter substrate-binding protein [Blastocatellia bacterium]
PLQNDVGSLNVINATDDVTAGLLWYHIYRTPVDFLNGADPPDYDPGLCTRWESSPDAKQWTFYLRKGVRWSDGAPFTVEDVLFTYNVIRDERVENALRDVFIEGREENGDPIYPELVKLDDHTFQFNLHSPNGGFLDAVFNLYLIPKHKWEQAWREGTLNEKMKITDDPNDVVGLGPFRIVEYVSGQRAVLERNPYFWKVDSRGQRLPYLDRVVFIISKDYNTTQSKFTAGEIDALYRVRAEDYALTKRLEGPDVKVEDIGVSLDTQWLTFNQNTGRNPRTGKPFVEPWKLRLFRNQRFRQAVSYAIDREGIANTAYAGRAVPIYSFVSPSDKYWYSDDVMKYPYDPARARQMLAEIGLKDTNGDGFLEDAEGHTVEITINTNSGNSQRENSASLIAKYLQDVGIKARAVPVALQVIAEKAQSNYDFDAILLGWGSGVPPGPINSKNILLSSGLQHICFPSQKSPSSEWEARVDELVHRVSQSADQAERKRLYAEIQRIWSEQLPEINLVAQREAVAYKNKFGNMRPSPMLPRLTWNIEEIYIKE